MCHFNDNRHKAIRLLSKRNVTLAYYYVSETDQTNWEELKSIWNFEHRTFYMSLKITPG